ncbi:MAG: PhoH family protein [Gammaproteobacteria bacterium]
MSAQAAQEFFLEPADNERLANLCGQLDEHLRQIEKNLGIEIDNRGNQFRVTGNDAAARAGSEVIQRLFEMTRDEVLDPQQVHLSLLELNMGEIVEPASKHEVLIKTRRGMIRGRGPNQQKYLRNIQKSDLSFGIGPAGTGKTFLAVACAVQALDLEQVRRIVLVRPAVEAGERLGFLPGDMSQKVDPYLRPIYDALYDMMGFERVARLMERNVIEVAPLAFMRGRTLNDSFVILDEAQNTTVEQMKMFLTRIGFGSRAVVTGDVTQVDIPKHLTSGLRHAQGILAKTKGVSFVQFDARDVVRHPLVQRIVLAYEKADREAGHND